MENLEKHFVERREWPRAALDALVEQVVIRLPANSAEPGPSVEIVNLSEAGAGILLPAPIERGVRVTLELTGKEFARLGFQAEIRWIGNVPVSTGQYPAGLKFTNLDDQRRVQLKDFIYTLRKFSPHGKVS
ncbi:MAG: PilZ domain-containing protein [Candidatus Abyssobacteria bacterium SURF_5]|uniref:PilZ domain-containing protein n=1 Tax=Abyssobacteria bacterium (strain SURF_5) TaxID=2093360 RepID=A0A3A4NNP5_ABYX5|nr:MAG: PilZ domain-containing protein [Candidatus Abyssubacteria bacterium SURF_5]